MCTHELIKAIAITETIEIAAPNLAPSVAAPDAEGSGQVQVNGVC